MICPESPIVIRGVELIYATLGMLRDEGVKRCRDADRKSNFTALKELMKRAPDLINAIVNTHIFHTNLGNWAEWL